MKAVSLARIAGLFLLGASAVAMQTSQVHAQEQDPASEALPSADALRDEAMNLIYTRRIPDESTLAGVALLEQAVAMGDVQSQVALGDLYLFGMMIPRDWEKARVLYEAAAEAGNGEGLHNYGMMLMWEERDAALAEDYLLRSGSMGVRRAWATLAEGAMYGYLGGGRVSRAKFDGYAARGREQEVDRIAVLEAIRYMWGISVTASGPETLATLERAANAGNPEAALFLIRLVRDGNRYNVRTDRDRAEELLQTYRDLLRDIDLSQLEVTINAARSRQVASFEDLMQTLDAQPAVVTGDFGGDLMAANPNAAIYVMQSLLRDTGYFSGRPDGLAGQVTIRALTQACREHLNPQVCADSAVSRDAISQLMEVLWQLKAQG